MPQRIVIDPVTRIEGHAKITIHLGDDGRVSEARFHVTEFRGFEKMCEGRSFRELPNITSRICGICPVSHILTSVKAGDDLLAVTVPQTAADLRRLINLGQVIQSHALSFFHLSSPDLVLGFDAPPEQRNILALAGSHREVAEEGVLLRKFGQEVIAEIAGRRIHPSWAVPGGAAAPLRPESRTKLLQMVPQALELAQRALARFKRDLDRHQEEARTFGNFPTLFLGMVAEDGALEHYDGKLRLVDAGGEIVADGLGPREFLGLVGEAVESWSYLKFPFYKPLGYPGGIYRVGPLARLNVVTRCGTPRADEELAEFRQLGRGAVLSSFHYHYARLIEILYAIEKVDRLLTNPDILGSDVLAVARRNRFEGFGACEAPRGTLFHHYKVKEGGIVTAVNLVIATGQNNLAMNRAVTQIARHYLDGTKLEEGMLNRVEAGIRAFDPCLSCSTHALGRMPLHIELRGPDGTLLDEVTR